MFLRLFMLSLVLSSTAEAQAYSLKDLRTVKDPVMEALANPRYKYLSREDIRAASGSVMLRGQLITVDTRDQAACQQVQARLMASKMKASADPRNLCAPSEKKPLVSIIIFRESNEEEWRREIDLNPLTSAQKNMMTETRNVAIAGMGVWGILYMMPESTTHWDRRAVREDPVGSYKNHLKRGPRRDADGWMINFLGHPYSGAAYYQVARHSGHSAMASFGYAVTMSTFFWEFGLEAVAEYPSIQDLIFTPLLGSIMGEVFHRGEALIQANHGKVLGSKKLGSLAMVFLNPMAELSEQINRAAGSKVIKNARAHWVVRKVSGEPGYVGLELQLVF